MEQNKPRTEMEAAIDEIALQETLPINRQEQDEEQNEIFHDSMTEEQWREQMDAQASGTDRVPQDSETDNADARTALQKVRDQEGREIENRLQKRWQDQKQKENESIQTEVETEKGGRQYPPTQITKRRRILRQQ